MANRDERSPEGSIASKRIALVFDAFPGNPLFVDDDDPFCRNEEHIPAALECGFDRFIRLQQSRCRTKSCRKFRRILHVGIIQVA